MGDLWGEQEDENFSEALNAMRARVTTIKMTGGNVEERDVNADGGGYRSDGGRSEMSDKSEEARNGSEVSRMPPPLSPKEEGVEDCPWGRRQGTGREGCGWGRGGGEGRAMRQRILGSHTPPCHGRMVITTQFNVLPCCTAALTASVPLQVAFDCALAICTSRSTRRRGGEGRGREGRGGKGRGGQ